MIFNQRLLRVYPELTFFDSEKRRKAAWKESTRRLIRDWRYWVYWICSLLVPGFLTFGVVLLQLHRQLRLPSWAGGILIGVLFGVFFGVAYHWLWRRPIRRSLRQRLQQEGVPICLQCGYDLRGQTEPRCSECGTAFDPLLLT